ncbi:MAG TPA: hypothetical protein VG900_14375 [Hyphomicrobiaceae bacterium]|nr:hypothetical protein [Hyphomicrobiaceae bacterium]
MHRAVGAFCLLAIAFSPLQSAAAASLPDIKSGPGNKVPDCVTPGRLTEYLRSRNPNLDPRFERVPIEYMRLGEQLGVRWDYAFYQMIIETGALSYRRDNRSGDVKPMQNNFAGLGATGHGESGESFKDIATGVRAHLEHLMLYAGDRVESPVAERTRKVQEWGVLDKWHAGIKRPITYSDLAAKWAPGTHSYERMLVSVATHFMQDLCNRPDPHPEMLAEARGVNAPSETATAQTPNPAHISGAELARRALEQNKDDQRRFALGAPPQTDDSAVPFKVLNNTPAATPPAANTTASVPPAAESKPKAAAASVTGALPKFAPSDKSGLRTAAAGPKPPMPPAPGQKCRVWTASYGGQKAMIIRSVTGEVVNYTVLDVNEGSETREADAFISAYAKDGKIAGEFGSQAQALDKAFKLCPEG